MSCLSFSSHGCSRIGTRTAAARDSSMNRSRNTGSSASYGASTLSATGRLTSACQTCTPHSHDIALIVTIAGNPCGVDAWPHRLGRTSPWLRRLPSSS